MSVVNVGGSESIGLATPGREFGQAVLVRTKVRKIIHAKLKEVERVREEMKEKIKNKVKMDNAESSTVGFSLSLPFCRV